MASAHPLPSQSPLRSGTTGSGKSSSELHAVRRRQESRLRNLDSQFTTWRTHFRELAKFHLPRRISYLDVNERSRKNDGSRFNSVLVDNTSTKAARVLGAGMTSGLTSPARPWFRLTIADPELSARSDVREWLDQVQTQMYAVFSGSNFYTVLPRMYVESSIFGTSSMVMESHPTDIIWCRSFPIGSYRLATDSRGIPNAIYRRIGRTAEQLKEEFGEDKMSDVAKQMLETNPDDYIDVIHAIEPNRNEIDYVDEEMEYVSCWWEANNDEHAFLRCGGYRTNPLLVARWDALPDDSYGSDNPGMDCLGDIKALQLLQRRKEEAIDKLVKPPLKAPKFMENERVSLLPGDVTFLDDANGGRLEPIYTVQPDVRGVLEDIVDVRNRINESYHKELFMMLTMSDRRNITAREVQERHEEKLVMLGPVLERYINEFLDPIIERTFSIMLEHPMAHLPPAPEEIQGQEMKVEYISILAQAQQAIGASGIERLWMSAASIAQYGKPEVLDKLDEDVTVDELGKMFGVPNKLIRDEDDVAEIRQMRAQQMAAQAQAEQAAMAAQTAKTASEIQQNPEDQMDQDAQSVNELLGVGI